MVNEATQRQFDVSLIPRLRGLGRRLRLYILLDGLAILFPAAIAGMLITLLLDRAFRLEHDIRVGQLISGIILLGLIAWRWVWQPLRVPAGSRELALLVERRFPQLKSRLISAVEFARADAGDGLPLYSREFMEAVVREADRHTADLRFEDVLCHRRARKQAAVTFACMGLLAIFIIGARPTMALWFQRNILLMDTEWPQRNRLMVAGLQEGKLLAARGDDVNVFADVVPGYETPRQVFIESRALHQDGSTGAIERRQMPAVVAQAAGGAGGTTSFTHMFERIEESLLCRISGGDARTDWFTIEVVERPRVEEVTMAIAPPAYTRLEAYSLRSGQTVAEVLKGSHLQFHIRTNKPVVRAVLVREMGGTRAELGPAGRATTSAPYRGERNAFTAEDAPGATASYSFLLEDELGFTNVSDRSPPLRLSVRLLADRPPGVKLRVKGVGEMITPQAVLPVEVDFADAYGLATAELVYDPGRKDSQPVSEPLEGFEPGTKTFTRTIEWSAAAHRLAEGDRLTLRAEARDFDDVSGPNLGQSANVILRVVSREELLAELNRREQEYRQDFERLIRAQEELYAEMLSLSRPVRTAEPSRDRLKAFNLLARRQRDHASRLNVIRLQFEQVLSELQINGMANPTVEARLGGGIIEPMGRISRTRMPTAAEGLDALSREVLPETLETAKAAQDAVLAEMNRVLANMQKWEGFQEAIALLREVLKMQGNLNEEIEKRIEEEIFGTAPAGTQPAAEPSK